MSGEHEKEDFADGMVETIILWPAVSAGTCFWASDESRWAGQHGKQWMAVPWRFEEVQLPSDQSHVTASR
jgi:hypothetical protein